MDIKDFQGLDIETYCNYVLNTYKDVYLLTNGLYPNYQKTFDELEYKSYQRFIRLFKKLPNVKREIHLTPTEQAYKSELTEKARKQKQIELDSIYLGYKDNPLTKVEFRHIELYLNGVLSKANNDKISLFNTRLNKTPLSPLNFINFSLNAVEHEVTNLKYFEVLAIGETPMFLNDYSVLISFAIEMELIQYVQFLQELKKEYEQNPNTQPPEPTHGNKLTLKQTALLFHCLHEKGVFKKRNIHQDDTKQVLFIAKLLGLSLVEPLGNNNFYKYWMSIQKGHDPQKVNTLVNQKAIEPFLKLIEK